MASTLSRRKSFGDPRRNEGAGGSGPNPFFARESTGQTHVTPNSNWAWGSGRLDRSSFSGHPHSAMSSPWAQHQHNQQQQLHHQNSHVRLSKDEYKIACRDRWINVSKTMIGKRAEIAMSCGSIYEGVIHALAPKVPTSGGTRGSYQVVMRSARMRGVSRETSSTKIDRQGGTLVLAGEDIVSITAKRFPLQHNARRLPTGLGTDAVIASRTARGVGIRSLKEVENSWVTGGASSSLTGSIKKWDQFEANRRLFNVTSSFDENLYTTRLDKSSLTKQQIADAERLAAEISSKPSSNIHVREERNMMTKTDDSMGEEERFGGVLGTGGLPHTTLNNSSGDENGLRQSITRDHDMPTSMASSAGETSTAGSGAGVYVPPALRPASAPVHACTIRSDGVEGMNGRQIPSTVADARLKEAKVALMDVLDGKHRSTPTPKPEVTSPDTSVAVETTAPQSSTRGNEEAQPAAEAVGGTPSDTTIPEKTTAPLTLTTGAEKAAVVGGNDVPASRATVSTMTASSNAPPSVSGAASTKAPGVTSNPPVPAARGMETGGDGAKKKSSLRASAKEWKPETMMGVGTKTSVESAAAAPVAIPSHTPAQQVTTPMPVQAQNPSQAPVAIMTPCPRVGGDSDFVTGERGVISRGSMHPAQQLLYPTLPQQQQAAMVIPPYSRGFMPATGAMGSVGTGPSHPMMALPPAQGQLQQNPHLLYSPWMGHHPQQSFIQPPLAGMRTSMAPGQLQEVAHHGVPTMTMQPGARWPFYDEKMHQQQQHYRSQMQLPPQAPVHQGQQQPRGFIAQGHPVAGPAPEPHYAPPEYRQTGGVAGVVDMGGGGVNGGEVIQGNPRFGGHARRFRGGGRGRRGSGLSRQNSASR